MKLKRTECYQSYLTEGNERTFWPTQHNAAVIKTATGLAENGSMPAPVVTRARPREGGHTVGKAASARKATGKPDSCTEKKKSEPSLTTHTKIHAKRIQDLNVNWCSHRGNSMGVAEETKNTTTVYNTRPSKPTPGHVCPSRSVIQKDAPLRSVQRYSQRPREGHDLNDHRQADKEGVTGLPWRSSG